MNGLYCGIIKFVPTMETRDMGRATVGDNYNCLYSCSEELVWKHNKDAKVDGFPLAIIHHWADKATSPDELLKLMEAKKK